MVNPFWEGDVPFFLVVKDDTFFSTEQKTIGRYGASWTGLAAGVTVLTALHKFDLSPVVLETRLVGVNSYKLKKASHARDVAYVISSVGSKFSPHRQKL